jgi:phospholipid transport system substrate-binding protein
MLHPGQYSHRAVALAALFTAGFAALGSAAEAQGGPATRYLRERNDEVNELLRGPASPERTASVTRILSDLLDYDELARRSLSTHWDGRTPAERTEFVGLLRQLVEQQYQSNMERVLDYEISYLSEAEIDGGRSVATEARSRTERRQPPIEITYSVHHVGSAWRVFDVTTDGVSMVQNYQQQFSRFIASDGWDGLIRRMRERLARGSGR